mgnify:CR=1 FL=1
MKHLSESIKHFFSDETAQSTVEYALIATALCVFGYGAVKLFGMAFGTKFNKLSTLRAGAVGMGP